MKFFSILTGLLITFGNCCTHGVVIRNPKRSEIEVIVEKFKSLICWRREFNNDLIRNNINNVYIVYDDDNIKPLAFLRIVLTSDDHVHICDLATLNEQRKKGYAKELINKIKQTYPNSTIGLIPKKIL